ncbi:AtpZ/AtpI family protein [Deltaproteobacteria bacterium TL4]
MDFPKLDPKLLMFSSMGLELGLSVIVGCVAGSALDRHFNTSPWLFLLFTFFGCVAGYRSIFRLLKKLNAESNQDSSSPPSP